MESLSTNDKKIECNELLTYYRNLILIGEKKECKIDIVLPDIFLKCEEAKEIIKHPKISLTPHIGAATNEAQERIGVELASLIIEHFKK